MDLEAEIDTCYESFVDAGGTMGEWNDLFLRSDLDAEELERVEAGEPREKYQHLVESVLSTGDLILYDVLDQDCHVTGSALGRVLEVMKTSKGEGLLKLWFVDSQDDQYRNWAREAFNERQDFLLHLCAGAAGDCKSKTKSKKIGWAHTDGWRLCSYRSASRIAWCGQGAIIEFRSMLERWLSQNGRMLKDRLAVRERKKNEAPEEAAPPEEPEFEDPDDKDPLEDGEGGTDTGGRSDEDRRQRAEKGEHRPGAKKPREDDGPRGFIFRGPGEVPTAEGQSRKDGRSAAEALKGKSPQLIREEGLGAPHHVGRVVESPRRETRPREDRRHPKEPEGERSWMKRIPAEERKVEPAGSAGDRGRDRKRRREGRDSHSEEPQAAPSKVDRKGRGDFLEEGGGSRKRRRHKKKEKKRTSSDSRSRSRKDGSSDGSLYGDDKARSLWPPALQPAPWEPLFPFFFPCPHFPFFWDFPFPWPFLPCFALPFPFAFAPPGGSFFFFSSPPLLFPPESTTLATGSANFTRSPPKPFFSNFFLCFAPFGRRTRGDRPLLLLSDRSSFSFEGEVLLSETPCSAEELPKGSSSFLGSSGF